MDYRARLEPEKFRFVTDELDQRFRTQTPDWVKYTVVLHRVTATQVEYYSSGSSVPQPDEMLDLLSGDCQDQTVLLGSMYVAAGFEVRMISVEKIGEDKFHVLPTVKVPERDKDRFRDVIRECYRELFNEEIGSISTNPVGDTEYLITDPEWSDYVGDTASLEGSYITEPEGKWHNVRKTWRAEPRNIETGRQAWNCTPIVEYSG